MALLLFRLIQCKAVLAMLSSKGGQRLSSTQQAEITSAVMSVNWHGDAAEKILALLAGRPSQGRRDQQDYSNFLYYGSDKDWQVTKSDTDMTRPNVNGGLMSF